MQRLVAIMKGWAKDGGAVQETDDEPCTTAGTNTKYKIHNTKKHNTKKYKVEDGGVVQETDDEPCTALCLLQCISRVMHCIC